MLAMRTAVVSLQLVSIAKNDMENGAKNDTK
jgi:hypothetical protein